MPSLQTWVKESSTDQLVIAQLKICLTKSTNRCLSPKPTPYGGGARLRSRRSEFWFLIATSYMCDFGEVPSFLWTSLSSSCKFRKVDKKDFECMNPHSVIPSILLLPWAMQRKQNQTKQFSKKSSLVFNEIPMRLRLVFIRFCNYLMLLEYCL